MKRIKSFIIVFFVFFFMFGISSCNFDGLMGGLVIPSGLVSSSNSTLDNPTNEENYLDGAVAQYGDLVNYYVFVEGMVKDDDDKLQMLQDVYMHMKSIRYELENNSSLSKEQYDYIINLIIEYKEQIRLIYEDEGTKVEEFHVNLFNALYQNYETAIVVAYSTYILPDFSNREMIDYYWVDMDTGTKWACNTEIVVDRDYNFRQEFSYESKDDCVDATYMTLVDVNNLEDGTMITNLKVVVTYKMEKNIFISDAYGYDYLIYGQHDELNQGDTVIVSATKSSYLGNGQLSNVQILEHVYDNPLSFEYVNINKTNVLYEYVYEKNYERILLQEAEIIKIDSLITLVKVGDVEIQVYKCEQLANYKEGQIVNIAGVIFCYGNKLQVRADRVFSPQKFGVLNVDYDNDGIIDYSDTLLYGVEFSTGVSEIENGRKFVCWEEVYVDENGFELVTTISTDTLLFYYVRHENVILRAVWEEMASAWDEIPSSYNHMYSLWPNNINGDAGGDAFAVINDSTAKFHENSDWVYGLFNTSWRYMIVVDGQGKIPYAVSLPANGYGGPSSYSYYAHPDYADDYTTNPAFNILEGYGPWSIGDDSHRKFEIVVPEGGFIITAHGKMANELVSYLSEYKITSFEDVALVNQPGIYNENYRLFFDEATKELRIYEAHDSVRYEGTNSGDFTYNEQTGLFEATFTLGQWNNIKFIYDSANNGTITLTRENTNFEGYFTEKGTYGADWTQNLYCDNEEEMKEGKFYCCTNSYTYFATFDPLSMTLKLSDELLSEEKLVLGDGEAYTFELGQNSEAQHVDGATLSETYTIADENYCFDIVNVSRVYGQAFDAMGNSALKIGTGTAIGTFTMVVDESVDYVSFYVAGYKSNLAVLDINGVEYVIETFSNDGNYTAITIDTTVNKTIVFSTVKSDTEKVSRCMIDTITFGNYA